MTMFSRRRLLGLFGLAPAMAPASAVKTSEPAFGSDGGLWQRVRTVEWSVGADSQRVDPALRSLPLRFVDTAEPNAERVLPLNRENGRLAGLLFAGLMIAIVVSGLAVTLWRLDVQDRHQTSLRTYLVASTWRPEPFLPGSGRSFVEARR